MVGAKNKYFLIVLLSVFLIGFLSACDCEGADYVFDIPQSDNPELGFHVAAPGCTNGWYPSIDSFNVNVAEGTYTVKVTSERGQSSGCQMHEDFYLDVNGQNSDTSLDDTGSCPAFIVRNEEDLGELVFSSGSNTIKLYSDAPSCSGYNGDPDKYNSVEVTKVCLYKVTEEEPVCGNDIVEDGEECDGQSGCLSDCTWEDEPEEPVCGNDIVEDGEECDGQSGCLSDCTWEDEEDDNETHSSRAKLVPFEECVPNWECSGWGECYSNVMTRTCTDSNFCEYEYNKPLERSLCQMTEKVQVENNSITINGWLFVAGIVLLVILILILVNLI